MTNYENRLLKFLKDNPKVRMTPAMIANVWKRRHVDVAEAAVQLASQSKINYVGGFLSLTCEGIGGA